MKKTNLFCEIVFFIAFIVGVRLLLPIVMEHFAGKQDYFNGIVLENSDDYIVIEIDESVSSDERLISKLGETVKIEKSAVVSKCDFSKFPPNENVRVVYSGIDSRKHELEAIFAIYTLSEIQQTVSS